MTRRGRLSREAVAALSVRSEPEETLAGQLRMLKIPHLREVEFAQPRKFRADFLVGSWVDGVLVEVEGGAYIQGRHVRGEGFERDCEKASLAAAHGYRVVRCTPRQIESGDCVRWIEAALGRKAA